MCTLDHFSKSYRKNNDLAGSLDLVQNRRFNFLGVEKIFSAPWMSP